jgi:hypothetical protein
MNEQVYPAYPQRPDPETFFTRYNNLIFLQTALSYFFNKAIFPIYSGNTVIDLMDYFPLFKQGYTTSPTLTVLFTLYNQMHNLDDISDLENIEFIFPDALYDEAFGSSISAAYYLYNDDQGIARKISMVDAVNDGILTKYLNSYEVMAGINLAFDPTHIGHLDIRNIGDVNSQTETELPELNSILQDSRVVDALIDEYMYSDEILDIMFTIPAVGSNGRLPERVTVTMIMEVAIRSPDLYVDLLNRLLADDRVSKLIYAILVNDLNMVESYINVYDPRDNDGEAYRLAIEKGNLEIIQLVTDAVNERNLLEQEVFRSMTFYHKSHGPHKELFQYSQLLK